MEIAGLLVDLASPYCVLLHSLPLEVHPGQASATPCVATIAGLLVELDRLRTVFRQAFAATPRVAAKTGPVVEMGGLVVESDELGIVPMHAPTPQQVDVAEPAATVAVAAVAGLRVEPDCLALVFPHPLAVQVLVAEVDACLGVAAGARLLQPLGGSLLG